MGSMGQLTFLIRSEEGIVFDDVVQPTAVFDVESGLLLKVGEYETMKDYFEFIQKTYRDGGYSNMADATILMELPHEQETVDKVFQITGYVKVLYQELMRDVQKKSST